MLKIYLVLSLLLVFAFAKGRQERKHKDKNPVGFDTNLHWSKRLRQECKNRTCDNGGAEYDKSVLSLTWSGHFCYNRCSDGYQNWSKQTLTVHGYWPSKSNLNCITQPRCPDPNCVYDYFMEGNANQDVIANLKDELDIHWPQWGLKNPDTFRIDQWNKHGTCYMQRMLHLYGNKYSKDQIFRYYFTSTLQKVKQHNRIDKPQYFSKADIGKSLGLTDLKTFNIICSNKSGGKTITNKRGQCLVKEIRICYDLAAPGLQKLTECHFENSSAIKGTFDSYFFLNHKGLQNNSNNIENENEKDQIDTTDEET